MKQFHYEGNDEPLTGEGKFKNESFSRIDWHHINFNKWTIWSYFSVFWTVLDFCRVLTIVLLYVTVAHS